MASNGKNPLHKGWSTRDIPLDEVLSKDTDRYGIRCGDNGLTCIDIDSKNHSQPNLMKTKFFDALVADVQHEEDCPPEDTVRWCPHFLQGGHSKGECGPQPQRERRDAG